MTVITTVNPSALLATASTATASTATAPTATAPTATASTATAPTATAPTATAPTATAPTATAPTITHYSMFEYYKIVDDAFFHFFNNTIYAFEPMPKFSKKKIIDMKKQAESAFNKERFEEITEKDIDRVAVGFAEELNVLMYELEEIGWGFIEEIAKRLCISPILLIESETYFRWAYDYFY